MLDYDPATGIFLWRERPGALRFNGRFAGKRAGYPHPTREYRSMLVDGVVYQESHLAWFYVYGTWPIEIDHINRKKDQNNIDNLRPATRSQNNANIGSYGKSRYRGVSWHAGGRKWQTKLQVSGKTIYLGLFEKEEDAAKAYDAAYVKAYGEFAVPNFP